MDGYVFGISLGIGSCGWAVLRHPAGNEPMGEITALGSWMFDVPETDKDRTPTNRIRRSNRLLRRVTRRRAQRMAEIRGLFRRHGLLDGDERQALKRAGLDPWDLRARGLDAALSPAELAVALGHIAKRRGYRSVAGRMAERAPGDDQKMLKALETTRARLQAYRTSGEMFARDPALAARKRNRDGQFDRTQSREDLIREVSALFGAQRRLGNPAASVQLEQAFTEIAFRQMAMQERQNPFGPCPFEPREERASRFAPSFERFRLLARLVGLCVTAPDGERSLTPQEIAQATADLGARARLTFTAVRKRIGLPADQHFVAVTPDNERHDIAGRSHEAMPGTCTFRAVLGERLWAELQAHPEQLDRMAHVLSLFDSAEAIAAELGRLALPAGVAEAVLADLGAFSRFKGAGHISALAARSLLPHLENGLPYIEACAAAGYDHAASSWSRRGHVADKAAFGRLVSDMGLAIDNPVARKSLTEGLKQLWAMRNRWGLPARVHIAMGRELGASPERRGDIRRAAARYAAERAREREALRALLGIEDVCGNTLLRYRLWHEQEGRCPYSGAVIPPSAIFATDPEHKVDHILPWSRFADDSFANKVLCPADVTRQKRDQTPCEWIAASQGEEGWRAFAARIEGSTRLRGPKKRNHVLQGSAQVQERIRVQNLHDSRHAARLLVKAAQLFLPEGERRTPGGTRRVLVRPGGLVAGVSHAWGVEDLKQLRGEGPPVEDARRHALDAMVVAALGDGQVERLTQTFREWEQSGRAGSLRQVTPPWGSADAFRDQARQAYDDVFVARPVRRRARGEGHEATVRQVRERAGAPVVYERKPIASLSEKRLGDIKDPERNKAVIAAIAQWIADGRPGDRLPRSPAGDAIVKVRLRTIGKPAVRVRGGAADRGEIVRVDVFTRPGPRGRQEFHLVPIYPHQVMNKRDWPLPPMRALVIRVEEDSWLPIDGTFTFRFSLHPRDYVEVTKASGEVLSGYFQGVNRATGAISLFNDRNAVLRRDKLGNSLDGIGAKTLSAMRKFSVDRLGTRSEVKAERRTWHGALCPPPGEPG